MIDLTKSYKTKNGYKVELITVDHSLLPTICLIGKILKDNRWFIEQWDEEGRHYSDINMDLIDSNILKCNPPIFENIPKSYDELIYRLQKIGAIGKENFCIIKANTKTISNIFGNHDMKKEVYMIIQPETEMEDGLVEISYGKIINNNLSHIIILKY